MSKTFYLYVSPKFDYIGYILGFDLDWTIIKPRHGKFPKDSDDVVFMNNRIKTLNHYQSLGYSIIIFTNQKVTKRYTLEKRLARMNTVINMLEVFGIHPIILMSTNEDMYRKPNIGMWNYLTQYINQYYSTIKFVYASYTGDAAGRPSDFSDSDIKFAENIGIQFYIPEQIF